MLGLETMREFHLFRNSLENIPNLNANVCIIGMSATASQNEQLQGFQYGMDLYCQKPVDTNVLLFILKTLSSYCLVQQKNEQNKEEKKKKDNNNSLLSNNEKLKNQLFEKKSYDRVVFPSMYNKLK